jgi:GNAT superfamily N-acetyltransferase
MKPIRPADYNDLPIIHDLAHKIWPDAYSQILSPELMAYMLDKIYSLSSLQNQFINLKHNFILVFNENIPVGLASFSTKENNNLIYRLHKIYLLPNQQGKGTGKMLLEHIINFAKAAGATSLELNVNRHNKARNFYEKRGFIIKAEEDIDFGQRYFMNDYIMELAF